MNKDWKLARKKGIGGSDAAAILGFSPWKSPMDVYLDKTGMAEDVPEDKNRQFLLELGTQLEPVIARLYERETGKHLQQPSPAMWTHSKHEILLGHPDRVVASDRGVELKSENQFQNEFGDPGTDQVPYHYLIQCAHYMAIGNYPTWDVALLRGGATFAIYTLHRDLELEQFMLDELLAWWDHHIVQGVPPDVDSSDAWKVYLRKKFPADILPIKPTDQVALELLQRLADARRGCESWETVKVEMENRLKLIIGEHEGLQGDFGKVTWRKTKDGSTTDMAAAFQWLANKTGTPQELREQILQQFTHAKPGVRRFLFSPRKGWNYGQFANSAEAGKLSESAAALQERNRESAAETP
jgi:putative phage-type endonuclease